MESRWNQDHFRQVCLDLMRERNLTKAELAEMFGIKEGSLHQYMYNSDKRPSLDVLQTVGRVTNRSITEFVDDPGAEGDSELVRFMSRVMGSDLSKMTDQQMRAAFDAWRAIVRGYEPPK